LALTFETNKRRQLRQATRPVAGEEVATLRRWLARERERGVEMALIGWSWRTGRRWRGRN